MSGIWRQSSTQEGRQWAENQEQVHYLAHADRRLVRQTVYCSKTQRMHDVELAFYQLR